MSLLLLVQGAQESPRRSSIYGLVGSVDCHFLFIVRNPCGQSADIIHAEKPKSTSTTIDY